MWGSLARSNQELTQKVTVYLNFSNKIQTLPKPESDLNLIISTLANSNAVKEKDIALQPYEGIVFQSQVLSFFYFFIGLCGTSSPFDHQDRNIRKLFL